MIHITSTQIKRIISLEINMSENIRKEIENRRTFAIISHPDAGKTTLTEKFLLYGGAINTSYNPRSRRKEKQEDLRTLASQPSQSVSSRFKETPSLSK